MIIEIISVGLIVSACLALFLDEAVYSVAALSGTFFFTALIYVLNGAVFVAIFQFAVGVGTLAILFLSGEMLSDKPAEENIAQKHFNVDCRRRCPVVARHFPVRFGTTETNADVSFGDALWNLRGMDVVLQGLVILMVTLGVAIVLYEKRTGGK